MIAETPKKPKVLAGKINALFNHLSAQLGAPAIFANYSRLVVDLSKGKGVPMLKGISEFSSNTDFFNPSDKPMHALLSRKEKIKGRVLPLLGQVSLFALSVGVSVIHGGLPDTMMGIAVLGGLVAYLRQSSLSNYKKKLLPENLYDPDIYEDAARFAKDYPSKADFPGRLQHLSREAGIEKTACIHVSKNAIYAGIVDIDFGKSKNLVIEISPEFLQKEDPALLDHIISHELGHARLGHTNSLPAVVSGTSVAMHLSAGIQMALAGNYLGGAFYAAAALAGHNIARAKDSQYKERECDRHALLLSGVGPEAAAFFDRESVVLEKDAPLGLRAIFGAINTYQNLAAAHPSHEKRANYMWAFSRANHTLLEKTRAKNRVARSTPPHFKTVLQPPK